MTIRERLNTFAEITGGRAWGLEQGKPRVYLPSRRDIKLYIQFDDCAYHDPDQEETDASTIGGCSLHCYINSCGQSSKWYASQKAQAIAGARSALDAAIWYDHTGDEETARRFVDEGLQLSDAAAHELANGRIDEARAIMGI
jgi:hypothetical protein